MLKFRLPQAKLRLIALDLDGTLLGADGQVGARNLAAVLGAEAAGITVAIATGRRHGYAMRVLRHLPLPAETVIISSNGEDARGALVVVEELDRLHGSLGKWCWRTNRTSRMCVRWSAAWRRTMRPSR